MRKVTVRAESIAAGVEQFKTAWKTGTPRGEFITFETPEAMLKTLTSKRWKLVVTLLAQGPMSVRALARQVDRDVKNVHADVIALKEVGLAEDHKAGVWVPFSEIDWVMSATQAPGAAA
ncbi:MAG: HVO_A0114 family putative DNA-binding protein [Acidiferrobacterales bacterium]